MPKDRSFLYRVRQALPDLTPPKSASENSSATFLANASYSAQELAALAHVSKATVTRFIQRLGYENYEEARRHARAEADGSRLFHDDDRRCINRPIGQGACRAGHCQSRSNVSDDLRQSDRSRRSGHDAGTQSVGTRFRSSQPFASYLQWQLTQVIEDIIAIPGPGQTLGEHLVSLREDDVVVFFAMRRRIAQLDTILAQIRKAKVKLIISPTKVPL